MSRLKQNIKTVIFGTDTKAGKLFDELLIITISLSVLIVLLESVFEYRQQYGQIFNYAEWLFTILFTFEYFLRMYCIRRSLSYVFSFYGLVDLLSILPTYISVLLPGAQALSVIRILRVLRIFRVLKLVQYLSEVNHLTSALVASKRKIFVFLFSVMTVVVILGSIMYLIEGEAAGYSSIPKSIYWAIVTLTTVGYGDIAPLTPFGQSISAIIMLIGYSIIAVPTGIVTTEIALSTLTHKKNVSCDVCEKDDLAYESSFCRHCGAKIDK